MGRIGSSAGVYVIVYLLDDLLLATQEDFGLEGQSGETHLTTSPTRTLPT